MGIVFDGSDGFLICRPILYPCCKFSPPSNILYEVFTTFLLDLRQAISGRDHIDVEIILLHELFCKLPPVCDLGVVEVGELLLGRSTKVVGE